MNLDTNLIFLKLGGSLITDKNAPGRAYFDTITRLASEIASALRQAPGTRFLVGHGSGSFGHATARKYNTQEGVATESDWRGFADVWLQASNLNRFVITALHAVGLSAVTFPPSAMLLSQGKKVHTWDTTPIQRALSAGLLPVVYGDVIFDTELGGTIFSTEMVFAHLAQVFNPHRVLIAGIEAGVWADYHARTGLIPEITPENFPTISQGLGGSHSVDVTGGMQTKVFEMLQLAEQFPGMKIHIFSGQVPGAIERAIAGEHSGTMIHAPVIEES